VARFIRKLAQLEAGKVRMSKHHKEKIYLKKQIIKILNDDNDYYLPEMIMEKVAPFFWRLSPRWVKDKAERIVDLITGIQNEKSK
jgi:hypothetical protein